MKIILKDVNLYNPHQNIDEKNTSVLLIDGIISEIGNINLKDADAEVYDLKDKTIVPGFFCYACASQGTRQGR